MLRPAASFIGFYYLFGRGVNDSHAVRGVVGHIDAGQGVDQCKV